MKVFSANFCESRENALMVTRVQLSILGTSEITEQLKTITSKHSKI